MPQFDPEEHSVSCTLRYCSRDHKMETQQSNPKRFPLLEDHATATIDGKCNSLQAGRVQAPW